MGFPGKIAQVLNNPAGFFFVSFIINKSISLFPCLNLSVPKDPKRIIFLGFRALRSEIILFLIFLSGISFNNLLSEAG